MKTSLDKLTKQLAGVAAALLLSALAACTVGPKYHAPTPQAPAGVYKESPTQFKDNGPWTVAQPSDAKLRGKWWEIFNDAELNALEEELNINNQNIKEYFENFMEARALVREARSQYFPTLSAVPSVSHSRTSGNLRGASTVNTTSGTTHRNGHGQVRARQVREQPRQRAPQPQPCRARCIRFRWKPPGPPTYGVRFATRFAMRNTTRRVSAADLENERLTEQASLAEYFFELRGQDELQRLYNETVEADLKELNLAKAQYETGITNEISVVQAETALQSAEAGATNVAIARAQYEHAIATLVGKAATNFSIPVKPMIVVPPPITSGSAVRTASASTRRRGR